MTYENISPSEAKSRMDTNPEAVIVDVRRPDEFVTGHIPGAINVPLADIQDGNIPPCLADKNAVYLIYCRSGVRQRDGCRYTRENGLHTSGQLRRHP